MADIVPFRAADRSEEFDCIECGRRIVRIIATHEPPICAHCLFLPGWHNDPYLVGLFERFATDWTVT